MADIVNLNRARKAKARAEKAAASAANRRKFGRTKAEKAHDRAETERALERFRAIYGHYPRAAANAVVLLIIVLLIATAIFRLVDVRKELVR